MTRPILASIDLQALKQNLTITRQSRAGRPRLVGGKSQCVWTRY